MMKSRSDLVELIIEGLQTDGGHHKQWFLEQLLEGLGEDVEELRNEYEWEEGVIP